MILGARRSFTIPSAITGMLTSASNMPTNIVFESNDLRLDTKSCRRRPNACG